MGSERTADEVVKIERTATFELLSHQFFERFPKVRLRHSTGAERFAVFGIQLVVKFGLLHKTLHMIWAHIHGTLTFLSSKSGGNLEGIVGQRAWNSV